MITFLLLPGTARADHPLLSEDTGVLGKDGWQVEAHGERPRDDGSAHFAAVLGYGITGRADVQLELPYVRHEGAEDPSLALKWRFFEAGPASMVLKPFVSEDTWGVDVSAAYEIGRLEWIGHLGAVRESLQHASIALIWAATENLKLVADFARDTNGETAYTRVLGVTYALTQDIDLGFGVRGGDERAWLFGGKLRW